MTYDDTGYTTGNNKARHHAGFYYAIQNLDFYASKGVSKNKLLIGAPFYGRSYTLINATFNGIGAPIEPLNPISGAGFIIFLDICKNVKSGDWKTGYGVIIEENKYDPFAYNGNSWVGYDDPIQTYV